METNANQKVTCIVNYPYEASEPDELTVRPGDVVRDVERLPGGWWRGELRGRTGVFHENFVSVMTSEQAGSRAPGVQGRCRAVFSYQPANPDELPLSVGDVLDVLGEVEEGWWQGRRQGRVGVFPSNFVVMLEQPAALEPAPALPPKPVKEQCRVLFPYSAVNDDELTLTEGDIVTIVSKDAPDKGWWRGELQGKVGLFPDNFVQLLPAMPLEVEEKKPDRPPVKSNIYPILNKYSEKTCSVKELSTSKISLHKENTVSKENSTTSTVTHTNKNESDKVVHSETVTDGSLDQVKKPPVPLKKSPTLGVGVGGLLSGLKSKMLPSGDKEKEKEKSPSNNVSSGSNSSGEWDRPDGAAASRAAHAAHTNTAHAAHAAHAAHPAHNANTFDHIERNSILNDPRAARVKAPRRRPPSQALRDDTPILGLSNGHEASTDEPPPPDAPPLASELRPRAREWEKHRAPWMDELKLNQAKKSDGKSRSVSGDSSQAKLNSSGDRIVELGLEEKRSSSHSMEMSKSTSSISTKMSLVESLEETKTRHSLDSKKETSNAREPEPKPTLQSPTAAGRTFTAMLDEIKNPPSASIRTDLQEKSPNKQEKPNHTDRSHTTPDKVQITPEKPHSTPERPHVLSAVVPDLNKSHLNTEKSIERHDKTESIVNRTSSLFEHTSTLERLEKTEGKVHLSNEKAGSTLERRLHSVKPEKNDSTDALIAHLNNRILNLEKLLEVQNTKFNAAIEELNTKLVLESEKRLALQAELEKFAHCVTQV